MKGRSVMKAASRGMVKFKLCFYQSMFSMYQKRDWIELDGRMFVDGIYLIYWGFCVLTIYLFTSKISIQAQNENNHGNIFILIIFEVKVSAQIY